MFISPSDDYSALSHGLYSNPNSDNTACRSILTPYDPHLKAHGEDDFELVALQNQLLVLHSVIISNCVFRDLSPAVFSIFTQTICTQTPGKVRSYSERLLKQEQTAAKQSPWHSLGLLVYEKFQTLRMLYIVCHVHRLVLSDCISNMYCIVNWRVPLTQNHFTTSQERNNLKVFSPLHVLLEISKTGSSFGCSRYEFWFTIKIEIQCFHKNLNLNIFI